MPHPSNRALPQAKAPFATASSGLKPGIPARMRSQQKGSAIQPYKILTGTKLLANMPASRPWGGYPYAVVTGVQFPAQAPGVHAAPDDFLTAQGGGVANIVNHGGVGLSLRVSDDNSMAIEESDLVQRQPKTFYATQEVVASANRELRQVGSRFQLQTGGQSITVLTGWYSSNTLLVVTPLYNNGNPDNAPQNCNVIAARILGVGEETLSYEGSKAGDEAAQRIGGISEQQWLRYFRNSEITQEQLETHLARRYINHGDRNVARTRQANQHARPEVGDSFMIKSVGYGEDLGHGQSRVHDIRSNQDRDLGWLYHFGGVVARSGSDRITLENYARGDDRRGGADPRWYFQMYGEKQGQSFHEFYSARPDYANPVTISYKNPNRPEPEPYWVTLLNMIDTG